MANALLLWEQGPALLVAGPAKGRFPLVWCSRKKWKACLLFRCCCSWWKLDSVTSLVGTSSQAASKSQERGSSREGRGRQYCTTEQSSCKARDPLLWEINSSNRESWEYRWAWYSKVNIQSSFIMVDSYAIFTELHFVALWNCMCCCKQ